MNRRDFILATGSASVSLAMPLPAISNPQPTTVTPHTIPKIAGKWFAVGTDERLYPYFAVDRMDAIEQFAIDYEMTLGDCCPTCSAVECIEHLEPHEWEKPQSYIETYTPKVWDEIPPENEPTNADWCRAGYLTYCEGCSVYHYDDPIDCYVYEDRAFCEDCMDTIKIKNQARINGENT